MLSENNNLNVGIRMLSTQELQAVSGGCLSASCPHPMPGSGVTAVGGGLGGIGGIGGLGDMGASLGSNESCPKVTNSKTKKDSESKSSSADAALGVPKLGLGVSADNDINKSSSSETTVTVTGDDCNRDGVVDGYEGIFKF